MERRAALPVLAAAMPSALLLQMCYTTKWPSEYSVLQKDLGSDQRRFQEGLSALENSHFILSVSKQCHQQQRNALGSVSFMFVCFLMEKMKKYAWQ